MDILSVKNTDNNSKKYTIWSDKMAKKKSSKHHSANCNNSCCKFIDGYSEGKRKDNHNDQSTKNDNNNSSMVWNPSGWIRVYCGPYRHVIDSDEPSRMMHVVSTATTDSIIRDMEISTDYTIWVIF